MKSVVVMIVVASLTYGTQLVAAQDSDFQTGQIVAVEKVSSSPPAGGTDAPLAQNRQRYNLTIRLADTQYTCRASTLQDFDLDWAQGKDVRVKVKGKILFLKRSNGKVVKLSILDTKKV
jgi:hypothetical protein